MKDLYEFLASHENTARGTSGFPIELYYVDRSHPRYEMPFHWHLEHEIMLVLSGSFSLSVDGKTKTLHKGDTAIILPEPSMAVFLITASMSVSYLTPAALWKAAAHCFTESTANFFLILIHLFILFLKKVLAAVN